MPCRATALILKWELRSRFLTSWDNILALIAGCNGCLELLGERLWTPLRMKCRQELPLHSKLCARCQALRYERQLCGVVLACLPRLKAAKAHKTNLPAGKRRCYGTCSALQKCMNCLIVPEYHLTVEFAFWIVRETWSQAYGDSRGESVPILKKGCNNGVNSAGCNHRMLNGRGWSASANCYDFRRLKINCWQLCSSRTGFWSFRYDVEQIRVLLLENKD